MVHYRVSDLPGQEPESGNEVKVLEALVLQVPAFGQQPAFELVTLALLATRFAQRHSALGTSGKWKEMDHQIGLIQKLSMGV